MPIAANHALLWIIAAAAVAAILAAVQPAMAAAAEADIVLKPTASGAGPLGLTVGLFAPDTTLKNSVEALRPEQSWPVTRLTVSLNANTGLCADHTIAGILELPNLEKDQANPDGPDCIFGAQIALVAGPHTLEIATECGDWVDNSATCWGYGQTGEFRLLRDLPAATAKYRLVFPGPATPAMKAPPSSDEPAAQKYGLFLDTVVDDRKVNKGDLWLVWTAGTVEIAFTR